MVQKHQLSCCALCQITASNKDSLKSIQDQIDELKDDAKWLWNPKDRRSGERACFVITSPHEDLLKVNLLKLGFEPITQFERRTGYPEGVLTMWFLKW